MGKPNANEDLSAYLDGELTDAEVAELEAELARDPELRADLDALEGVVQFMREEGPDMAPLGFHNRVMARIEAEHPERPSVWAWLRRPLGFPLEGWLVGLAAAAVLLLVIPKGGGVPDSDGWVEPPPDVDGSPAAVKMPDLAPAPTPEAPVVDKAPVVEKVASKDKPSKPVIDRAGSEEPAPEAAQTKPEPAEKDAGTPDAAPEPLASPGYRYVVRSDSPEMKLALLRLAGRYGGAVGLEGGEVTDSTMSQSEEDLLVQVAQRDLTRFARELEALGYEVAKEPSTEIVAGSTIPVRITLQLVGGSIGGTDAPPNAARSQKQLDFEAEISESR